MKIELWDIGKLKPYEDNPRRNEHAVAAVARSIKTFGFRQPIVVDKRGVIIVGDTRYKAAKKLGLKKVPVHVARGLTPAQIKAYRIADNKTGELADWDQARLVKELVALQHAQIELDVTGFSADELQALIGIDIAPGLNDPDVIPLPPDQALTRPGDLWILDQHRLLCGDAAKTEDVDRLLAGAPVHLIFTDSSRAWDEN